MAEEDTGQNSLLRPRARRRVNGQLERIEGDGWQEALEEYRAVADDLRSTASAGQAKLDSDPRKVILEALRTLFRPEQVVELRVPRYPRGNATTAGYFDDAEGTPRSKYAGLA